MKRPGRPGDRSDAFGHTGHRGEGADLSADGLKRLAQALLRAAERVRSGQATDAEVRAVEEAGRALRIDLAAAAAWSPSLVLSTLLTQPDAAGEVAGAWSGAGLGDEGGRAGSEVRSAL